MTGYRIYQDTVDMLLKPYIERGVLLPRELDRIEHKAFSEREIRKVMGGYTEDERFRDIGEEKLRPYRSLPDIHPVFSRDINEIVGGYSSGLDIPVYTPRVHRPRQRSPRIYSSRPSGSRRSSNRKTSGMRSKPTRRSPPKKSSQRKKTHRRSRR